MRIYRFNISDVHVSLQIRVPRFVAWWIVISPSAFEKFCILQKFDTLHENYFNFVAKLLQCNILIPKT